MILFQLSLDFATIHVYHIISFTFKNGWYSTQLQVSPLRCVSHNVCHHIDFTTVGMKVITTNKFAFKIKTFNCISCSNVMEPSFCSGFVFFWFRKMKIRNILSSCFSTTFVATAIGLAAWHLLLKKCKNLYPVFSKEVKH